MFNVSSLTYLLRTALSLMLATFAFAATAQTPIRSASDIIERIPNLIVKANSFGTELAIEGETIVERTPCKPLWPMASLRNNETGSVKVAFLISTNGFVRRAKIVDTSGFRDLDRATMVGFLGCKFKPQFKDGLPTDTWHDMTYVWKIE